MAPPQGAPSSASPSSMSISAMMLLKADSSRLAGSSASISDPPRAS